MGTLVSQTYPPILSKDSSQVASLYDRFGRHHTYLRISLTDRCNLRCSYCMPPEGIAWQPHEEILTRTEILRLAKLFVQNGVTKIRLTGGEPMLRPDLDELIQELSKIPSLQTLAMTTNGVFLKNRAKKLRAKGLSVLNISLDTLQPHKFIQIAKRDHLEDVLAGIEAALIAGFKAVKLNVVVMAGVNEDELMDFVRFVKDRPLELRLIEYMPFKDNQWSQGGVFSYQSMKEIIQQSYKLIPCEQAPTDVAKEFKIPGFQGGVSFITSMTESFCSTCNRIRLTADGSIKSCLFHPAESSLRDLMRQGATDEDLLLCIQKALSQKEAAHLPMEALMAQKNRSMIQIGG
ncbi:MAG: GTP 3',8-cyclase MoaA [Cyanobacteria bacterium]|nr:GTP 3',8-cyclase MoaA [Cyanobacteriota bacterium]